MSIICTVYLPEGIIMAADSRATSTGIADNNLLVSYTSSDNAQKVFLLDKAKVGVSCCGNLFIDGKTIADYLRIFEIEDVEAYDAVPTIACKLRRRLGIIQGTYFHVAGYHKDIPYVYDVTAGKINRFNYPSGTVIYGAMWSGQKDAITKLHNAAPALVVNYYQIPLRDGIDFSEYLVDLTIKYERFQNGIQTCGGPIDILVLTKDNSIWYRHKVFKP